MPTAPVFFWQRYSRLAQLREKQVEHADYGSVLRVLEGCQPVHILVDDNGFAALLPGEPSLGWTGAGGGSGSPRERPNLQEGECFIHNAVLAAASPSTQTLGCPRPALPPARSLGRRQKRTPAPRRSRMTVTMQAGRAGTGEVVVRLSYDEALVLSDFLDR